MGFFNKLFGKKEQKEQQLDLNKGLEKTKLSVFSKLSKAIMGKSKVDEEILDSLEEALITSDVGVETTFEIIARIEKRVANDKYINTSELNNILKQEIMILLKEGDNDDDKLGFNFEKKDSMPFVLMVVGVNGVGKTTTIGKIAAQLTASGKSVVLGAADTFRAAAIEQLSVWADRASAKIVKQRMGSDPASVAFDTLKSAVNSGADVVIIDTAGRLHNKVGLMNELTKIKNVMAKIIPNAPHEVMLVLDGSTGQNAYEQAKHFTEATEVSSLAITKLDGTAKGGVVLGISHKFNIPVRFIGVGEGVEHLLIFDREQFVSTLFEAVD